MTEVKVPTPPQATEADGDDYRLEQQIGFLLRRAHQYASDVFQARMGARNLTPQQFSVLVTLLKNRELAQTKLGEIAAMDPATVLGVVQRLAQRGLVAVRTDPADGRRRLVQLTRDGHEMAGELVAIGPVISRETLAGLSPEDQRDLLRLLDSLGQKG
ncbi:MarR family transcriptional regulator [Pelagibius litoralis]|uniref:MarR family transcriptional regulator n=1 Tax=Pelagibius litoralis TaxID=374515 RepID=A0A967KD45_9PROT|nr:MarR family transcriptional regulator [Pelagibius litoralis]NIA70020.1 MarR family transcriptional regulator [Pelagibius litoralis]